VGEGRYDLIVSRASGRFATAVHALSLLACSTGWVSSDLIARSIGTTAAHVRRILADLSMAGLVTAHQGRGGGYRLACSAASISLADVSRALEGEGVLTRSACDPSGRCFIGAGMRQAFDEVAGRAQDAVLSTLEQETVADVARRAQHLSGLTPAEGFRLL
jgi:Rrf2 family protein